MTKQNISNNRIGFEIDLVWMELRCWKGPKLNPETKIFAHDKTNGFCSRESTFKPGSYLKLVDGSKKIVWSSCNSLRELMSQYLILFSAVVGIVVAYQL